MSTLLEGADDEDDFCADSSVDPVAPGSAARGAVATEPLVRPSVDLRNAPEARGAGGRSAKDLGGLVSQLFVRKPWRKQQRYMVVNRVDERSDAQTQRECS